MENKEIYIDGVDVSGCECYSEHREGYCGWFTPCEGDSCQYKLDWALQQLKAKEQECEELKKVNEEKNELLAKLGCPTIATARMKTFTLEQQLDQLKAENDTLFKAIEEVNKINKKLETKNEELKKIIDEAKNSKLDLKSFLVSEAVQKEYEERLNQLKEELAISIQENEKGREINAELKEEITKLKNNITSFDYLDTLTNEQVAVLYTASIDELAIRGYKAKYNTEVSLLTRYKQTLTEIKEIAEDFYKTGFVRTDCGATLINNNTCIEALDSILQKCEVLDE